MRERYCAYGRVCCVSCDTKYGRVSNIYGGVFVPGRIRQIHYHKKLTPPVCPNNYCITVTCNVHIQEIKEEGQLVQLSDNSAFPFHSLAIPGAQKSHYTNRLCPNRAFTARSEVRFPRREACLLSPPPPPPPPLPPPPPRTTDFSSVYEPRVNYAAN